MGALSDHAFDLTTDNVESLDTAIRYNMLYAILIVAMAFGRFANISNKLSQKLCYTAVIFIIGTSLFSFGIYMAIILGVSQFLYLTPIGGIFIMGGWVSIIAMSLSLGHVRVESN